MIKHPTTLFTRHCHSLPALLLALGLGFAPMTHAINFDDSDGDGIIDEYDPDPNDGPLGDLDHDGISNMIEECFGTDPNNPDSDGDSVPDGEELYGGTPLELCTNPLDTDGDGIPDALDTDDDNDGIPTRDEAGKYGFTDGNDGSSWDDPDHDGLPNYRDTDSDNDGKPDSMEWGWGFDKVEFTREQILQFAHDLKIHGYNTRLKLGIHDFPDHDGDGIPDVLDAWDEDGPTGDADQDGLSNMFETFIGTDPFNRDTDADGLWDNEEVADDDGDGDYDLDDFDDDGIIDVLDADDDNDGAPTFWERTDADGDGIPDYHDPDSYGNYRPQDDGPDCTPGQIPDGSPDQQYCVDRDCDGIVDAEENPQEFYVGGTNPSVWDVIAKVFTGDFPDHVQPPGSTQPALYDGQCALDDYDCDGVVNYIDPDWTDGPGENGQGDPMCNYFN
ncbi:MAG: hypothetical protein ABW101_06305 [Candidatus Thiodiazotropha sp.]